MQINVGTAQLVRQTPAGPKPDHVRVLNVKSGDGFSVTIAMPEAREAEVREAMEVIAAGEEAIMFSLDSAFDPLSLNVGLNPVEAAAVLQALDEVELEESGLHLPASAGGNGSSLQIGEGEVPG